jgi:predicted outer membrane protein
MPKQSFVRTTGTVMALLATGTIVCAQQRTFSGTARPGRAASGQFGGTNQTAPSASSARTSHTDHYLVNCLISGNQEEITLARLAQQRSNDKDVKQFAKQMIDDHTKFMNQLQTFKSSGASNPTTTRALKPVRGGNTSGLDGTLQTHEGGPTPTVQPSETFAAPGTSSNPALQNGQPGTPINGNGFDRGNAVADRTGRHMGGGAAQFIQILKQVSQKCLQSKVQELSQKEGTQFDRCYMGMQVGVHMEMADKLTVFEQYASADLRPILHQGLEVTRGHLGHAKKIMQKLEKSNSAKPTAGRDRGSSQIQ